MPVQQMVLDKVRHNRLLSPAYYWSHSPLLVGRKFDLEGRARRCRDELRSHAATTASMDALGIDGTDFWREIDALAVGIGTDVAVEGDLLDGRNTASHCISVDAPDLLRRAPAAVLLGVHPRILDIVESYLRVPVALTALHLRKDIGTGLQTGTRIWHRDSEDHRVVRMIVYLSDVGIDDGPFEYLSLETSDAMPKAYHERGLRAKGDPLHDDDIARVVPRERWCQVLGPRGTIALADNARLFHHGRPHESQRTALFYTYTSRSPRYPEIVRNPVLDDRLTQRQRDAFFLATAD